MMLSTKSTYGPFTGRFWVDVVERIGRQAAIVGLPLLTVVSTTGSVRDIEFPAILVGFACTAVLIVLQSAAGASVSPAAPVGVQIAQRVISSAAGALVFIVPTDLLGLLSFDVEHAFWAAAGAAGLSLVAFFTNTPKVVEEGHEHGPDGEHLV